MTPMRPQEITQLAWFVVVLHAFGALSDVRALIVVDMHYPVWLVSGFLATKSLGVIAGVLLLKMKKVAIWLYAFAVVPSFLMLNLIKSEFEAQGWMLNLIGSAMVALFAVVVRPHWSKLAPSAGQSGLLETRGNNA